MAGESLPTCRAAAERAEEDMLVVGRFAGLVVAAKGDAGLIRMQSNINKEHRTMCSIPKLVVSLFHAQPGRRSKPSSWLKDFS